MAEQATSPCPLPPPVLLLLLLLLLLTLMASAQPTYAAVDTSTAARAFCCCRGTVESPKTYVAGGWAGRTADRYIHLATTCDICSTLSRSKLCLISPETHLLAERSRSFFLPRYLCDFSGEELVQLPGQASPQSAIGYSICWGFLQSESQAWRRAALLSTSCSPKSDTDLYKFARGICMIHTT